mmetsp:Transcript_14661/g.24980  ORF Transcript_14661/g.24980 Transcript_14661/m.24980 type:complete len:287 (-) Transcript_14661:299-1159(-)
MREQVVNSQFRKGRLHIGLMVGNISKEPVLGVGEADDGGQSNEQVDPLLQVVFVLSKGEEHLGGSLGVANVGELLLRCGIQGEFNLGGHVELAQVNEAVIPELLVLRGVQGLVLQTVGSASVVPKPDVEALEGKDEGRGVVGVVPDPAVRCAQDSMLQVDDRGALLGGRWRSYSLHGEEVAILSLDLVLVVQEAVVLHNLLEGFREVREDVVLSVRNIHVVPIVLVPFGPGLFDLLLHILDQRMPALLLTRRLGIVVEVVVTSILTHALLHLASEVIHLPPDFLHN